MPEQRYIHVRNWDRHQHADTTRGNRPAPWIKDYTAQLHDEDYLSLGWADQGVLQAIRRQYATNRGRGINDSTTSLHRLFGHRVTRAQLERLNHAGFIEFSASKTLASCKQPACLDLDVDKDGENPLASAPGERDQESASSSPAPGSPVGDGGNTPALELADALVSLFGPVAKGTLAAGKRSRAMSDLRATPGATPELVLRAARRWPQLFPTAHLTDVALAKHYPQLTVGMRPTGAPPCPACGMGGGMHLADCEHAPAPASSPSPGVSSLAALLDTLEATG